MNMMKYNFRNDENNKHFNKEKHFIMKLSRKI